tara:strand:- start:5 stop:151 length:147 start_codon:yes stop_codon:yes gene_type:complete
MDIKEENTGSKLIAHIEGEIDLEKTDDLREKIEMLEKKTISFAQPIDC